MEDPQSVKNKVQELNRDDETDKWDSVEGFYTLAVVIIDAKGGQSVDPSRGITVKLFVNIDTGEIKTYWAKKFLRETS